MSTFRIATFNVQNMFDRAKALSSSNWSDGKVTLASYQNLNATFNKKLYSAADKARMVKLLNEQGMAKSDEGPLMLLREIRGKLLKRSRTGGIEIVANGRADWVGWVELKTEGVNEVATTNTARVLAALQADIQAVVEAENRTLLKLFNQQMLPLVNAKPFKHVMLFDGNDDRGIDVGILTRESFPIVSIRSHVDDTDDKGVIFSRDCAEYEIALPNQKRLWVLVNHFKSKGYGVQADNDAKRLRQAKRVREIVDAHLRAKEDWIVVLGDLNDTPDSPALAPLLGADSPLKDISSHNRFDAQGREGTHGNCTASSKIDYILLSTAVYKNLHGAGVERRGMWGGTQGTLWPHFPEVGNADQAASDHAGLWAEISLP